MKQWHSVLKTKKKTSICNSTLIGWKIEAVHPELKSSQAVVKQEHHLKLGTIYQGVMALLVRLYIISQEKLEQMRVQILVLIYKDNPQAHTHPSTVIHKNLCSLIFFPFKGMPKFFLLFSGGLEFRFFFGGGG